MIRPARPTDAPAIAAIWNAVIRGSVATFNSVEKTEEEIARIIATAPVLVWDKGAVLGFATYSQFRGGVGYRFTVESTIYLDAAAQGQGAGRALMAALEAEAAARGMHSMISGISAENAAGLRFHAAIGYAEIARLPQVGHKFGRWLDLVLMQKYLTGASRPGEG